MFVLSRYNLNDCIRNSIHFLEDDEGFSSFLRFTRAQLAVYERDPLYRLMSYCSSGVCLELETNSDELCFECKTADFNPKTLVEMKGEMSLGEILQMLGDRLKKLNQAGRLDVLQHFDLYVDDIYCSAVRLSRGRIVFALPNPEHRWLKVKIFFPLYKPLYIRNVTGDGDWRPCKDVRPVMYSFGDSITQGFIAGKPSLCYVSQLAELLCVNALNQGIGGAMYNPAILTGFADLPRPDFISVAYGTNDWHNAASIESIRDNTSSFFTKLNELYADIFTFVITPIWRDDTDAETSTGPFTGVIDLIREIAGKYKNIRIVDGLKISPHNPACYSDGFLHPNTAGFSYMAPRIYKEIISRS